MGVAAVPTDPRATFNYSIEIDGLEVALAQVANVPDVELGDIEHNGAGSVNSTHTAGRLKFGVVTLEKVMPAGLKDTWAWDWLRSARDPATGVGLPAAQYKKTISIIHYGQGTEIIDRWDIAGVYPQKITYSKNDAGQDNERLMETVELRPDSYVRV